jgi:hypothetical protein
VNSVVKDLERINIANQCAAQDHVGELLVGKKIKSIRELPPEDVYCMDVPETHCFIANGIVSHNCLDALRYIIFSKFFGKSDKGMTPQDLDNIYREAMGEQDFPSPFRQPNF